LLADELKEYIIQNDLTPKILEDLNCVSIVKNLKEYRCGLPNDHNKNRIAIKSDTLKTTIYKSNDATIRGNIFTLCMEIKGFDFYSANKYLHYLFGLEFNISDLKNKDKIIKKENPLNIFTKVKRSRCIVNEENQVYDENIIRQYEQIPHMSWIREGIMPKTCKEFNIGYSFDRQRIVIPHRLWYGNKNDYLGVIGRTTIEEYEMLDIPKYYPLKKFYKGLNLYGLQENYKYIQEAGYVVVYEAEKSVLKRHSLLDKTGVALCCHDITPEQIRILIGLDVDIIIALDKGISINHVRSICNNFYGIRNVSYIWDKYDLLKDKESPADVKNKIYNYLFKYKVEFDEKERKEYLKWLENQKKS
jgi:DNA primase